MNITTIAISNAKGQIVIPKKFRDYLRIKKGGAVNLTLREKYFMVEPILGVVTDTNQSQLFDEILRKTKGTWAGDDWPETEKKRHEFGLAESKKAREEEW